MFNKAFDDDIVEVVDERIIVDESGFMYKMFIIVFSHTNELFQEMVLSMKAIEGKVFNPLMKLRIENVLKYTRVQSYWDISMAKIIIRVEEEMERIGRIKEVDKPIFAEVEYIDY